MTLCDDHTSGTSRGFPTPAAQVADNDLAVGLNPAPMTALQKAWEAEIAHYFPRGPKQTPDLADANLLDHAIWYATSNFSKPFPGDDRILYPSELR